MPYDVYMHDVPKVGDNDKPLPIKPHKTQEFADLEEAKKVAAQNKATFERVNVIHRDDGKQKLVERYMDGEHIVPPPPPPSEPAADASTADASTADEPAADEPAADEPAADEPAADVS